MSLFNQRMQALLEDYETLVRKKTVLVPVITAGFNDIKTRCSQQLIRLCSGDTTWIRKQILS